MSKAVIGVGSGNLDLLEILQRGPDVWNQWREENPDAQIVLSGADLSDADLSDADLSDADLSDANLSYANLSGAHLNYANLSGADLSYANLSDADLSGANLSYANLSGAHLNYANLSGAHLNYAHLSGADLRHAIVTDETKIDPEWLSNPSQLTPLSEQTHCNIDIKVFDSEINSNDLVQLKSAIEKFVDASGYEEVTVISEQYGSWFKRVRLKIARLISQEVQEEAISAGQEFYRTGKASALNRLEKTGVESTKQIAEATAEILKAVENLDDVVMLLGKLIVMKYTNDEGRSKTYVKTISSDLQFKLESTPKLLDSPQAIIDFLKSQEKLPPAIEDQKALPVTPEVLK